MFTNVNRLPSTAPSSGDASEGRVYRFLNEDGTEQMGGLAIVFLSSQHNGKTTTLQARE